MCEIGAVSIAFYVSATKGIERTIVHSDAMETIPRKISTREIIASRIIKIQSLWCIGLIGICKKVCTGSEIKIQSLCSSYDSVIRNYVSTRAEHMDPFIGGSCDIVVDHRIIIWSDLERHSIFICMQVIGADSIVSSIRKKNPHIVIVLYHVTWDQTACCA